MCRAKRSRFIYVYMLLAFLGLFVLTRWITRHVQGIGLLLSGDGQIALLLYFLLILPGVILHELSHAIVALVLGVPVRRFSLGLGRRRRGANVALGSVEIASADPIRSSLIGLAPLVSGCIAIVLIGGQILGLSAWPRFGSPEFWSNLRAIYHVPDFGLWLYLVLAISNAMLPSASDRRAWGRALTFILFVALLLYLSGLMDTFSITLSRWAANGVGYLAYAFATAAAIDLVFVVLIFVFEQGLGLLGFGRIQYHS